MHGDSKALIEKSRAPECCPDYLRDGVKALAPLLSGVASQASAMRHGYMLVEAEETDPAVRGALAEIETRAGGIERLAREAGERLTKLLKGMRELQELADRLEKDHA